MTTIVTPKVESLTDRIDIRPLLFVSDIQRSISFYCERLGFTLEGEAKSQGRIFWCRLSRQGCSIMLQQEEEEDRPFDQRGKGIVFYFVCKDADVIYQEFTERGLSLRPPTTAYYGMRQIHVAEPDGYNLCFESPV